MVYDLLCDTDISLCSFTHRLRGVEIPVETREVATGDVKPDPMPDLENVAGLPEGDGCLVDRAGSQQAG